MYKINFKCQSCSEDFNVSIYNMINKNGISCPNCSNELPNNALQHIKTVASSLQEYLKAERGKEAEEKHFKVTIQ